MAVDEFTPEELAAEEWRDAVGTPNHEVSNLGRCRRRGVSRLFGYLNIQGYPAISIGEEKRMATIHSLVAAAFIGPRPSGLHINHIDGVKANNRVTNLEYVTCAENIRHAARLGLMATGDRNGSKKYPERLKRGAESWAVKNPGCRAGVKNGRAKLDDEKVREIRRRVAVGEPKASVARCFGVTDSMVGLIHRRQSWADVKD